VTMPINDKTTISLPLVVGVIAGAFAVGGWAVSLEVRVSAFEDDRRLLTAICRKLNCDGEGMRQGVSQ
jgi:hypothetical protein